ncbi:hypothetical protein BH20CHL3_BH20CHL3_08890 [soil metagenome]
MMYSVELTQEIQDKQVRYRHEAYRGRFGSRPLRRRIGIQLILFGEALRGKVDEGLGSPEFNRTR